ncbi:Cysteine proteinase inhibitor [Arachis hypogaea]|nr:Cysteine proteinase inhibitor [Arachis hypogaea]
MRSYCHIMLFLVLLAPINLNVEEPWVIEMANFAVTEHNKRSNANLKLAQVLSCGAVSASPISNIYTLRLLANDGVETHKYTAQLIQMFLSSTYNLQSFELAPFTPL